MEVLVIDVGGTGVKLRTSTSDEVRRFRSGPELTPEMLVEKVTQKTVDWRHDVVSIGYPGSVAGGSVIAEPGNLGSGWEIIPLLRSAMASDYVVLGGGNGRKVEPLPPFTYPGRRDDAFEGGVRLWEEYVEPHDAEPPTVWRIVR